MKDLIEKLSQTHNLTKQEWVDLLTNWKAVDCDMLFQKARTVSLQNFGNQVYVRGLIEFTNYCKNDCFYCGIRKSNRLAQRYRLSPVQILSCCESGYDLGFRTFVLQGGEDPFYSDDLLVELIQSIKSRFPDCALTLSIGEKSHESYQRYHDAGADRYLLRHETADEAHYAKLHPKNLSLANRKQCLASLKEIGYQVGTGFMVGSPFQTPECLAQDLLFIQEFHPQMVGIGPFVPHHDTPFGDQPQGDLELVLFLLAILRLLLPHALLPATTALGTIHPQGRERGILAGANVVMPNLSPVDVRKKYALYDNKICTGEEAAECKSCLQSRMEAIGYTLVVDRGDYKE